MTDYVADQDRNRLPPQTHIPYEIRTRLIELVKYLEDLDNLHDSEKLLRALGNPARVLCHDCKSWLTKKEATRYIDGKDYCEECVPEA